MGSVNTTLMGSCAGIAVGSVMVARVMQPGFVFMPPRHHHGVFQKVGAISYKVSEVPKSDVIIIYSHGNAEDVCTVDCYQMSQELGYTVVTYDYPGYGLSSGTPDEAGCINALSVVTNHIAENNPTSVIIHVGRSLGTGVLTQYAYIKEWTNPIILISPFKSIGRILYDSSVSDSFSGMFRTCDVISSLKCPVKIIHGTEDNLVPCYHGQYLYSKLRYPIRPTYKRSGHNDLQLSKEDVHDAIRSI